MKKYIFSFLALIMVNYVSADNNLSILTTNLQNLEKQLKGLGDKLKILSPVQPTQKSIEDLEKKLETIIRINFKPNKNVTSNFLDNFE